MEISRRGLLVSGAALLLAACSGKPAPEPEAERPRLTFSHLAPIKFGVETIDIQQPFVASGQAPNVEHLLANPPALVAERWARDRLRAVGDRGIARYSILDASVVETRLKKEGGVSGALKTQNDSRYDGRIEVRLDVDTGRGSGFATAVVTRSQTALEDLTLNERDELLVEFVEAMGRDLDQRLEDEILRNLSQFLE